MGSIPGRETKIPHAMWHGQKKKEQGASLASDGLLLHIPQREECIKVPAARDPYPTYEKGHS